MGMGIDMDVDMNRNRDMNIGMNMVVLYNSIGPVIYIGPLHTLISYPTVHYNELATLLLQIFAADATSILEI
jgi:hypothetical protein